jgi:hypothetical protein
MNKNEFIDELLSELSYRSDEGYPILTKSTHITLISEILDEWDMSGIKNILIENLIEADKNPDDDKYSGIGGNPSRYVKKSDYAKWQQNPDEFTGDKFDKSDNGKYSQVEDDGTKQEPEVEKKSTTYDASTPDGLAYIKSLGPNDAAYQAAVKAGHITADGDGSVDSDGISTDNKKIVKDFKSRVEKRKDGLSSNHQQILKDSLDRIDIIYSDTASNEQKVQAAQWLVDNAGFSTNQNKRKAYFNKLGGNRKIISGDAGTDKSADLVAKVSSLVELKTFDSKGVKQGFTTAAKPDLGNENIIKPSNDKRVAEYFEGHPVLKKIRPALHGIFGIKDENGNVKMPSSEYSKDYLKQSINNPALQNTIDFAKTQVESGGVDVGVLNGLESHKKRMDDILKTAKIPSKEAAKSIADSYNTLMIDLHNADSDVASAILKQLAENNLYEQELANGEEVYLPSAGNFPAGDKIKGGMLERVSLVSCKFGKEGRTYGCPANSKSICELHQDKSKQNNQGQYLGEDGYTLLINDDLIKGETNQKTKEKTKEFINNTLGEIGLGDTFTEDETEKIASTVANYMDDIDRIKKEVEAMNPADKTQYWKIFGKKVAEIEEKYKKELGSIITKEHASKLIGENNAKNLVQTGGVKVESLLSAIEIANNIRTNQTLTQLEHNKQYYDDNNEPKFVTDMGTNNPNDYSITFRTKRTAGRTGGGCQLSFTGDGGEYVQYDLNKDGSMVDTKTGNEVDV